MRSRFFALVVFIIAALLPAGHAAAQSRGNSAAAHEAHKKDKTDNVKKDKTDNGVRLIAVPEPATIVLLGAAAGLFGVRKIWQHRRRIVSD
jgi:PEP-CTERM motif